MYPRSVLDALLADRTKPLCGVLTVIKFWATLDPDTLAYRCVTRAQDEEEIHKLVRNDSQLQAVSHIRMNNVIRTRIQPHLNFKLVRC